MATYTVEPTGRILGQNSDARPYDEYRVTRDGETIWTGNQRSCDNEQRMREYNDRTRA